MEIPHNGKQMNIKELPITCQTDLPIPLIHRTVGNGFIRSENNPS